MITYMIASSHKEEDCDRALDEMLAKGPKLLEKFVYGCKDGDHTGYAIVDVKSRSEALALIPAFLQDDACMTKVDRFTPAEIRSLHEKAA
mgnify:FL=1